MRRTLVAKGAWFFSGACVLLLAASLSSAQPKEEHLAGPQEPVPPPNQTYIGTTKCSSCHFAQFTDWRQQQKKHADAFTVLPAQYRTDATCLKCHATGHGEPSGFKTAADRHLASVSCEACHGPGSAHAELTKSFANAKQKTPEQEKIARDSIYRMLPQNVCVTCHSTRAHAKHPEYVKTGAPAAKKGTAPAPKKGTAPAAKKPVR